MASRAIGSLLFATILVLAGCVTRPPSASTAMGRQDLVTGRPDASLAFYQEVFGWSATRRGNDYWEQVTAEGAPVGGVVFQPSAGDSAIWLTTLRVENLETVLGRVSEHQGQILHGPCCGAAVKVRGL